jgi:hypothetical protein
MQTGDKTPNYGNRPVEEEGLLSRLFKRLAQNRTLTDKEKAADAKATEVLAELKARSTGSNAQTKKQRFGRFILFVIGIMLAVVCVPLITLHALLTTFFFVVPVGITVFARLRDGDWATRLHWVAVWGVLTIGGVWCANRALDESLGEPLMLTVTDKYVTQEHRKNRAPRDIYHVAYVLSIPADTTIHFAETATGDEETLRVDQDVYALIYPGQTQVALTLRQGFFNLPWVQDPHLVLVPSTP